MTITAAILGLFLMGQATPTTAPKIPDADQLAFFQAQAAFNQAQSQIQAAGKKLQDDCGKDHQPSLDKGVLSCVTPPPAPKPEVKK